MFSEIKVLERGPRDGDWIAVITPHQVKIIIITMDDDPTLKMLWPLSLSPCEIYPDPVKSVCQGPCE